MKKAALICKACILVVYIAELVAISTPMEHLRPEQTILCVVVEGVHVKYNVHVLGKSIIVNLLSAVHHSYQEQSPSASTRIGRVSSNTAYRALSKPSAHRMFY